MVREHEGGGIVLTFQELLDAFLDKSKPKVCYKNYCHLRDQYISLWSEHPTFLQIED
jgi:hypothetical protein